MPTFVPLTVPLSFLPMSGLSMPLLMCIAGEGTLGSLYVAAGDISSRYVASCSICA